MVNPVSEEEHYEDILRMLDELIARSPAETRGILRPLRGELRYSIEKKDWARARRIAQGILWNPDDHL